MLLVITVTACSSSRGFDRGSLKNQITDQIVVTEEDIKKVLDLKPQIPIPFKLAIYFSNPIPERYSENAWQWLGEDKDKILEITKDLIDKNIVSNIFVINDSIVGGTDNKGIRLAAARAGADAVVIINGISDLDRYNNVLGITYILLVTPLFVPGTEADALFVTNASMWDVRNQYLYLSVEAEGTASETRPAAYINEKRVIKAAKTEALGALKQELLNRVSGMGAN